MKIIEKSIGGKRKMYKNKKILKPVPTEPIRKICGDCYYNGFCKRKIKECVYLEEEQKKCKTKDCKK